MSFRSELDDHDGRPTVSLTTSVTAAGLLVRSQVPNPERVFLKGGSQLLRWHNGEFIITLQGVANKEDNTRARLYSCIAQGLLSGTLPRIRRCPQCQVFFIAKEERQKFCKPSCGREFHDKGRDGDDKVTRGTLRVKNSRSRQS